MARSEIVGLTKELIYGQAIGERPSIRRAAAAATVTVTGSIVTFILLAGEGAKVAAGDVLALVSENDATKAYAFYVLSITTDTVTAVNGYRGTPVISNASADLDSKVLEQNPTVIEGEIHRNVDTVFGLLLWPHVFKYTNYTIVPDLADYQVVLNANVMEILDAYQKVGNVVQHIPRGLVRNISPTLASTGVLGSFGFLDGSDLYLTAKEKLVVGDEDVVGIGDKLLRITATGCAALSMGASISEATVEPGNKENQGQTGDRRSVGSILWRDFVTLRSEWSYELARDQHTGFVIRRPA